MGEIWGRNGRETAVAEWRWGQNVQRDPRFGRNTELPSEDPFLTGIYAAGMISGAVEEDQGVPRMLMYMKHFGERCP